jgi:hypothetical protein
MLRDQEHGLQPAGNNNISVSSPKDYNCQLTRNILIHSIPCSLPAGHEPCGKEESRCYLRSAGIYTSLLNKHSIAELTTDSESWMPTLGKKFGVQTGRLQTQTFHLPSSVISTLRIYKPEGCGFESRSGHRSPPPQFTKSFQQHYGHGVIQPLTEMSTKKCLWGVEFGRS